MWPLIKTSLAYNRTGLILSYGAAAGIWVMYLFDPAGTIMLFGIPALFLMIALFSRSIKEKHERLLVLLPIPIKQRSYAGLALFAALFYAAMLSLWPVQHLVARTRLANEFITLPGLLALSGVTLGIFLLLAINFDLRQQAGKGYSAMANVVLVMACAIPIGSRLIAELSPATYAFWHELAFQTPIAAVAVNLLCVGLAFVHVALYCRRASYLE